MNNLLVVGGTCNELDCAHNALANLDWLEHSFVLCDGDSSMSAESAFNDRIRQSPVLDMITFVAKEGGQVLDQILRLSKIAKTHGILSIVIVESENYKTTDALAEYSLNKDHLLSHADSLLLVPKTQIQEGSFYSHVVTFLSFSKMLLSEEGFINLELSDFCTVFKDAGLGYLGNCTIKGSSCEERMQEMSKQEIVPEIILTKAQNVLIQINGCMDFGLDDLEGLVGQVQQHLPPDTPVLFGASFDSELQNEIQMALLATGF